MRLMQPQISPEDGRQRTITLCLARACPQVMQSSDIDGAKRSHPHGYSSDGYTITSSQVWRSLWSLSGWPHWHNAMDAILHDRDTAGIA
jgi:hypothetical protein